MSRTTDFHRLNVRGAFRDLAICVAGLASLAGLLAIAGCASGPDVATASILTPVAVSVAQSAPAATAGAYVMSAEELAFDCKKLTGRMQIRILEIRDYDERNRTSAISRSLQSGVAAVTGGTTAGTDPSGAYAKDRAMLDAYNAQLAAMGCKTYDLNAELQPKDFRATPSATIKPAAGPAGKR